MRMLLLLFISLTIFLAGMVFGGKEQVGKDNPTLQMVEGVDPSHQVHVGEVETMQEPSAMNFTQKTASFLEGAVEGIYDVIVTILYEIASIFFSIV